MYVQNVSTDVKWTNPNLIKIMVHWELWMSILKQAGKYHIMKAKIHD